MSDNPNDEKTEATTIGTTDGFLAAICVLLTMYQAVSYL